MALHPFGVSAFARSRTLFPSISPTFGILLEQRQRERSSSGREPCFSRASLPLGTVRLACSRNHQAASQTNRDRPTYPGATSARQAGASFQCPAFHPLRPPSSPPTVRPVDAHQAQRKILPPGYRPSAVRSAVRPGPPHLDLGGHYGCPPAQPDCTV
jgi:hypothetical protein